MGSAVGAGVDGPDVAGIAAERVGGMPPVIAVPPRGNHLPGVRPVLGRPSRPARSSPAGQGLRWPTRTGLAGRRLVLGIGGLAGGVRDADGVEVEPVGRLLDEKEDQLVAAVEPVADGLGHGVGLVPDDRVAQDPPVLLEGERDPPRLAEQVLGRHARCAPAGQLGPT